MKKSARVQWKVLTRLFWSFFKIGPITFGGGYAMVPVFHKETVERRRWLLEDEVADILAVAQSAPGSVGVNSAVFVGYRVAGVPGALSALAGVLLPTFLIVLGLCISFLEVRDQPKMKAAFEGIRPAVVALIAYAGIRVGRTAVKDAVTLVLALSALALLLFTGINPIYVILGGLAAGVVLANLQLRWFGVNVLDSSKKREYSVDDYFMGDGI